MAKKVFVSYDDNGKEVKGYFELIKKTNNFIEIKSGENSIIIPYHKINKIKEKLKGGKI